MHLIPGTEDDDDRFRSPAEDVVEDPVGVEDAQVSDFGAGPGGAA